MSHHRNGKLGSARHRADCAITSVMDLQDIDYPKTMSLPACSCGRDVLLARLKELSASSNAPNGDAEVDHEQADKALLKFIGDKEIAKAFLSIKRWYS